MAERSNLVAIISNQPYLIVFTKTTFNPSTTASVPQAQVLCIVVCAHFWGRALLEEAVDSYRLCERKTVLCREPKFLVPSSAPYFILQNVWLQSLPIYLKIEQLRLRGDKIRSVGPSNEKNVTDGVRAITIIDEEGMDSEMESVPRSVKETSKGEYRNYSPNAQEFNKVLSWLKSLPASLQPEQLEQRNDRIVIARSSDEQNLANEASSVTIIDEEGIDYLDSSSGFDGSTFMYCEYF
ncbi:hypothetical protein ACLMJK_004867 [Lecanora helva]